jgi:hypothetical protein
VDFTLKETTSRYAANPDELDPSHLKHINELHSVARDIFTKFILDVEKNTPFKVIITSGYRTFAEQLRVQLKNESFVPPRPATDPGLSYHNYGLALDINLESKTVNGLIYGFNKNVKEWINTGVPQIAESLGLRWGGRFSEPDQVHFDYGSKYQSMATLKSQAESQFGTDPNNIKGNQISLA